MTYTTTQVELKVFEDNLKKQRYYRDLFGLTIGGEGLDSASQKLSQDKLKEFVKYFDNPTNERH